MGTFVVVVLLIGLYPTIQKPRNTQGRDIVERLVEYLQITTMSTRILIIKPSLVNIDRTVDQNKLGIFC